MSLQCPFSPQSANEKVVRLTAFLTILLTLAGLFSSLQWIALLLCFDFFIRGFTNKPWSPLRRAAKALARLFRLKPEPINAGPKIFAAKIGFVFCTVIATTAFAGLNQTARILSELLVLLAALEAFFKICVGCHIYSMTQTIKRSLSKND